MSTVHERLIAILGELPAIGKGAFNEQQRFHYRSHDDVLNALNPLLAQHGVFVVPDVLERVTAQRTTAKGSTMYEVNLHVRFTFYGAAGDSVTASGWGEGTDLGDKATNKAMTMAFKYVLAQTFAIATADTLDADAGTPEETVARHVTQGPPPISPPKSWAKLTEMVSVYDQQVHDWFMAFCTSARLLLFPDGKEAMTAQDKSFLLQKAAAAALALREQFDPGALPPPTVDDVRRCFAMVLDGQELALEGEQE